MHGNHPHSNLLLIASLIPLMIAGTLVPSWITAVILLLQGQQGTHKAIALVAGMTTTRALQIVVFGILFQISSLPTSSQKSTVILKFSADWLTKNARVSAY